MKRGVAALAAVVVMGGYAAVPTTARADSPVPVLPANCSQPTVGATVSCSFSGTGAEQTFSVPSFVTSVHVDAIGAAGGATGGAGAEVAGDVPVTGGSVLYVEVGGVGSSSGTGGFNGGGSDTGAGAVVGAGGGGASDVRTVSSTDTGSLDSRLLVAGGGGGSGYPCTGGSVSGGGPAGADGVLPTSCLPSVSVPLTPARAGNSGGAGGRATTPSGTSTGGAGDTGIGGGAGSVPGGGGGGGGLFGGGQGSGQDDTAGEAIGGGGGGGGSSLVPTGGTGPANASVAASVVISYSPGDASALVLSPATAEQPQGVSQAYTATTVDSSGATVADVTADTTLSGDGLTCSTGSCSPDGLGPHTVTATDGALSATASLTGVPGPAASLTSTATATATAGTSFPLTVTANDAAGNPAAYTGTVHFTSTDPHAVLPADYAFTTADAGTHTFSVTLKTAGSETVTATDTVTTALTTDAPVTVSPAAATSLVLDPAASTEDVVTQSQAYTATTFDSFGNVVADVTHTAAFSGDAHVVCNGPSCSPQTLGDHTVTARSGGLTGTATLTGQVGPVASFAVSAPATATAGTPIQLTVTAQDAAQDTAPYTGTLHLSSTDAQAVLPADYTFTAADAGVHTFDVTLESAGAQRITFADTSTPALSTFVTPTVSPAAPTHLVVSPPTAAAFDVTGSVAYTAESFDDYGNAVADVTGASVFTGPQTTCTAATCTPLTLGDRTVTATDGALSGTATLTGVAGPAAAIALTAPSGATAGDGTTVSLTATDAGGNATAYYGTVHVTSSDPQALLPADFTVGGTPEYQFTVRFRTAGHQTLTVTDTAAGFTAHASIDVVAGAPAQLSLNPATASVAVGTGSQTYTVTGTDAYGNSVGDLTSASIVRSALAGASCSGDTCSVQTSGDHQIVAQDGVLVATADLIGTGGTPSGPTTTPPPATGGATGTTPPAAAVGLTITRSAASIAEGKKVMVSGRVTRGSAALAGVPVIVREAYTDAKQHTLGIARTDGTGRWSFTTKPLHDGTITAFALGQTASTKVAVTENYYKFSAAGRGGKVAIYAHLHPGFTVTASTRLTCTIVATGTGGQKSRTVTLRVKPGVHHAYEVVNTSITLPKGTWTLRLTVSGVPGSTTATSGKVTVRVA